MIRYDEETGHYILDPNTITGGGGWDAMTGDEQREALKSLSLLGYTDLEELHRLREAEDALES